MTTHKKTHRTFSLSLSPPFSHTHTPCKHSLGDFVVGSTAIPEAGVEVENWGHKFTHEGEEFIWNGQFTRFGCFPVRTQVQGDKGNFFSESFVDLVAGIPDPNAFVVPPECNQ